MKTLTREELSRMTPKERIDHLAASLRMVADAQSRAAEACREFAVALPLFAEACGRGRGWKMSTCE